ncbi:MAG: hypothetical protein BWY89_01829 [Bacteroidetes bacterium ADurb.BinA012]|nr:MAG: hypothetical protein BWY89_01829 [Bacteroidetes bacterium ADurb.BinA012]
MFLVWVMITASATTTENIISMADGVLNTVTSSMGNIVTAVIELSET